MFCVYFQILVYNLVPCIPVPNVKAEVNFAKSAKILERQQTNIGSAGIYAIVIC